MCDAMLEQISIALCREYRTTFGRILHHNIDKGLLVAGRTAPRLGGGTVLEPMRLVIGDRATAEYKGKRIDANRKNPVSHVGKIYSFLTHHIAATLSVQVPGLREVYVCLGSQIGQPVDQPVIVSAQVIVHPGVTLADVQPSVIAIIEHELSTISAFTARLAQGEWAVW
jgi:S-adenosylmethionine synthetase